ncbi:MAG: prepilin-type N-terminal cleavage/methylation domain-containing protein [Luteolibacter sp.]
MISAARTSNFRSPGALKGFTLFEIVVVLALSAMIVGGAIGMMVYSSDERALRDASTQIEVLAKKARTKAILKQRPYAIVFHGKTASLTPFGQAGQTSPSDENISPTGEITEVNPVVTIPEDMGLSILRWNTGEKWIPIQKDVTQVWRFDPEGLSEPIGIRYQINQSWQQDTYHPLTATIHTTELEAR